MENLDPAVVAAFGCEWRKFNHGDADQHEMRRTFETYFAIFPWGKLAVDAEGFDLGCGTGRWANFVALRVGKLHCIDPSEALGVARERLAQHSNCVFHQTSVDSMPLVDSSMDFGYSLGVLHHCPDTPAAVAACVRKLKPGAPLLLYLYYAFDNRPAYFRVIWKVSDYLRRLISRLPFAVKAPLCELLALLVYWPLARTAKLLETIGLRVDNLPLSAYRGRSFYAMRTDCLDRFGTRLERRFTRRQITEMMEAAGLENIVISEDVYWCAVGYRR